MSGGQIDTVMHEDRLFPPPAEFAAKAQINAAAYEELYERAKADPQRFWGELAKTELHWFKPFAKVLEWNEPFAKWFVGGKTNVSYNCLDAHLATGSRQQARRFIWEGEPGDTRTLTYQRAAPRSLQVRQRAQEPGHRSRATSRFDLHADGAGAGDRHARLRPDRRDPLA